MGGGTGTYGVFSFNREVPWKSKVEFAGNATPVADTPFAREVCGLLLE